MAYPRKKDIQRHSEELIKSIRLFVLGINNNPIFVVNTFEGLFTDVFLQSEKVVNGFPALLKGFEDYKKMKFKANKIKED